MKLSLVFPAYNEAASIMDTLNRWTDYCRAKNIDHEIVVVDDGSQDATGQKISEVIATQPSIRLITHSKNQGYGAALRSGWAAATGDFIFFTDADGQFQPEDLERTLPLLNPTSLVLGYRQRRSEGFGRQLNSWLWARLASALLEFHVRDLNCAWKVFPRSLLSGITLISNGAFINAELLYYAQKNHLAFQEISVQHFPRQSGSATGAKPRVILRAFQELWMFLRLRQQ